MIYQAPTSNNILNIPYEINFFGCNHIQEPIYHGNDYSYFTWFFVKEGKGEVIIDNYSYVVEPGQCFIIFPKQKHSYKALSDKWTLDFIAFSGINTLSTMQSFNIPDSGVYILNDKSLFQRYIDELIKLNNLNAPQRLYSKLCYSMIIDLSDSIKKYSDKVSIVGSTKIKYVLDYLENNYMNMNVCLDLLADLVGLSKYHLCRIFKQEVGVSIITYLLNLRLLKARHILRSMPNLKINDVASLCGISSSSYFIKVFKRMNGVTPEEYRKNMII